MAFMKHTSEALEADLVKQVAAIRMLPGPSMARAIRVDAGVTQARLANAIGVHRVTLARWESGGSRPRGAALARYAHLLKVLGDI